MDSIANRNPIRYAGPAVGGATPWPMFSSCREGLQPDMISYKSSAFAFAQVANGPEGMMEKTARGLCRNVVSGGFIRYSSIPKKSEHDLKLTTEGAEN